MRTETLVARLFDTVYLFSVFPVHHSLGYLVVSLVTTGLLVTYGWEFTNAKWSDREQYGWQRSN